MSVVRYGEEGEREDGKVEWCLFHSKSGGPRVP